VLGTTEHVSIYEMFRQVLAVPCEMKLFELAFGCGSNGRSDLVRIGVRMWFELAFGCGSKWRSDVVRIGVRMWFELVFGFGSNWRSDGVRIGVWNAI